MNTYYLKKFRKEANKKLKLVQIKHNLYYVAKIYDDLLFFPKSDDLPYDEAVKKLKEVRQEYISQKVYEKRLEKSKIIKNI
jgi:hypothetical protein